ncbi:MAG: hypothetical protein KatS3mg039_0456 [Candidatus Kapaibacterium sp.]|nr:MAG: hypothetical protein KatS3mg039_0456 [Candidatus Kapabacteria bacterium]
MACLRRIAWLLFFTALTALGGVRPNSLQPPQQLIASYNDEQSATLRWEAVPGARLYRFQISEQRDFTTIRTDALLLPSKSWIRATIAGLEPGKMYWWRVQAIGNSGESAWSLPVRLSTNGEMVGVPVERLPADRSVLAFCSVLRFSWRACDGATSYRLQLSPSPTFDRQVIERESVEPYAEVVELVGGRGYYWRVQARRGSESGQWSPVQQFTLLSLANIADAAPTVKESQRLRLLKSDDPVPVELVPNPVADVLTVRTPPLHEGGSITLFDVVGRQMLRMPVAGVEQAQIPVGQLPAGSYTIVITTSQYQWVGTVEVLR